jgi:lathosterol oxidase
MEHLLHTKALLAPSCVRSRYGVNLFLCVAVYLAVNASWCAARGRWPPRRVLRKQVLTSLAAAPFYALLPWLVEEMALGGWTRLHAGPVRLSEALAFLAAVEVLVYAVHRGLHESRWLYAKLHRAHHEYKTAAHLSPFASMAFSPLDGLAQASPYALVALVLPCHLGVWEVLLFLTGVWSSNIHDTVDGGAPGVLGARHHLLHHTHFRCNYGQYLQVMDRVCGTFRE